MTDLADLCLHPAEAALLRWFFQRADGELGLQSNHEAVVNACLGGRNKGSKPVSAARQFAVAESRLKAADKARLVARRLDACSPRDRRTLAAAFGGPLPRRIARDWERLTPLGMAPALLYLAARRRRIPLAQLEGAAGALALQKLLGQARADLAVASTAYEVAR